MLITRHVQIGRFNDVIGSISLQMVYIQTFTSQMKTWSYQSVKKLSHNISHHVMTTSECFKFYFSASVIVVENAISFLASQILITTARLKSNTFCCMSHEGEVYFQKQNITCTSSKTSKWSKWNITIAFRRDWTIASTWDQYISHAHTPYHCTTRAI